MMHRHGLNQAPFSRPMQCIMFVPVSMVIRPMGREHQLGQPDLTTEMQPYNDLY